MKKLFYLFFVLFKKDFREYFLRYPVSWISEIALFYLGFIAITKGLYLIPVFANIDRNSLQSLVLGFIMWILFLTIFSSLANTIAYESMLGTLEQLFLGKYSIYVLLVLKVYARAVYQFILFLPVVMIAFFLSGFSVSISPLVFFTLIVFFPINVYIISIPIISMTVIFKKIGAAVDMYQYLIIGLMIIDINSRYLWLMPFLPVLNILKAMRFDSGQTFIGTVSMLGVLTINTTVYYFASTLVLRKAIGNAKKNGTLGQY